MQQNPKNALMAQYKALRRLHLAYLIAAILSLVLYFVDKRITLTVLGASLIYYLALVRPRGKAYQKAYVHVCAQLTLERYLDDAVHTEAPTLNPDELRAVRLVAANGGRGSILCREGGKGKRGGRLVWLGDVTFAHSFPMEGKTHHEFVTGTWVTVELGRDTGLDWRLLHRRVMMKPSREKLLRENPDLQLAGEAGPAWVREDWMVVRRQGTPDFPGNTCLEKLRAFAGHTSKAAAVCVLGTRLHVFIANRILGQKVGVREEPTEARVNLDRLPELRDILAIADCL